MPERFHVRLVPESGGSPERVVVEVGMEGFNVMASEGGRTLRKYPLHHITRWSMRGTSLILFTRSPVDIEDRTVTLQGDEHTIRSVLDMLTCSCMQMAELLQNGQAGADGTSNAAAATSINAMLRKSKKPTLLTADQVDFTHNPEKQGWMHSQGEHIKTWRKRWFVLKQGFLFRFADSNVTSSSKPRGIVDLSQVTDVTDGTGATGRPCSIKLSTATSSTCYLCDNETAQVEWISALEGTVTKLVRMISGIDDEPASKYPGGGGGSLADQLMRSYNAASGGVSSGNHRSSSSHGGGHGSNSSRSRSGKGHDDGMIKIINYQQDNGAGSAQPQQYGGSSSHYGGGGGDNGSGYVNINYGNVAGAQSLPADNGASMYDAGQSAAAGGAYPGIYQYNQQQQPYSPSGNGYGMPQQQPQQPIHSGYGAPAGGNNSMHTSLFDAATAPPAPAPAPSTPWQIHYTAEGRPYYYNSATGITSWEAPNA